MGDAPAPERFFSSAAPSRNAFGRAVSVLILLCAAGSLLGCGSHARVPAAAVPCQSSVQARVSAARPTVTVSYTEPSATAAGGPLEDLAKTSIYYDLGRGRTLAKEVPATNPTGGGQISETITIPIESPGEQSVSICVTATDRHGNESASSR
jgi:hypothetical protein